MKNSMSTPPACIGFIMDGNRRFAKKRGLPSVEGHRAGYAKLKEVLTWVRDANIRNAVVYALSTENWNRTDKEITYLLDLIRTMLSEGVEQIAGAHARIIFAGDVTRFPDDIRRGLSDVMERTKNETERTLVVALSYGGRAEIIHAVNELLAEGVTSVDEQTFSEHLWTRSVPDPDLIIRTGGEMRLSNFLPWQSTYSELFFTDTLWPEFGSAELTDILEAFLRRTRRHGV